MTRLDDLSLDVTDALREASDRVLILNAGLQAAYDGWQEMRRQVALRLENTSMWPQERARLLAAIDDNAPDWGLIQSDLESPQTCRCPDLGDDLDPLECEMVWLCARCGEAHGGWE